MIPRSSRKYFSSSTRSGKFLYLFFIYLVFLCIDLCQLEKSNVMRIRKRRGNLLYMYDVRIILSQKFSSLFHYEILVPIYCTCLLISIAEEIDRVIASQTREGILFSDRSRATRSHTGGCRIVLRYSLHFHLRLPRCCASFIVLRSAEKPVYCSRFCRFQCTNFKIGRAIVSLFF